MLPQCYNFSLEDMKLVKQTLKNVPTLHFKKFRFFSLHLFD